MLGKYQNGNYITIIEEDGTKTRLTNADSFIPAFAENCDVKITDKCSQECSFCYEGCTQEGAHADLNQAWVNTLHPYTELALNGNDLDHPDLENFLKKLKSQKVIANITVNQNQFKNNFNQLKHWNTQGLIHGIGISLIAPTNDFIKAVKEFPNAVIHTINGLLSAEDINKLSNNDLKLLVLGYKTTGRGDGFLKDNLSKIVQNNLYLYDNLATIVQKFQLVSFDNLALKQLDVEKILTDEQWEEFYMGDDGHFTFYIDMVNQTFAKNSVSQNKHTILNNIDDMFNVVRQE